jgi:hypothetical protein
LWLTRRICFWINFDFMSCFPFCFLVLLAKYLIYLENFLGENRAALADPNNYDVIVFEPFRRKYAAKTVRLPSDHARGIRCSLPKKVTSGPVIIVVTRAMITSMVKMCCERMPMS